jgi:tripeptidyl-peptidase-1
MPLKTAVGATQIKTNTNVTAISPEEACETVIYSGGGFSNVLPLPSYQASAVASYYSAYKPPYSSTQNNNSQAVRGYPDVAANSTNYVVGLDGQLQLLYGTSCSSPTFGALP